MKDPNIRISGIVGRIALYSLTAFILCSVIFVLAAVPWLLLPLGGGWIDSVFRKALQGALISGFILFIDLFILHRFLVPKVFYSYKEVKDSKVNVALTAYNDEVCIGSAVKNFKKCQTINRVIVAENNSTDDTRKAALEGGVDEVITETVPGYGACCIRAMAEAAKGLGDDDIIILCEGDMTFSEKDVKRLLAYMENSEMVLGTRTTQELRALDTQMDWLINPMNQIVAKMIQVRFWGIRLTDVGCTYRAIRISSYNRLKSHLVVTGNHFSAHMIIEALKMRMHVIEIPVIFMARAGRSKGVGFNKLKAAGVATRMLRLLYTS